MLVNLKKMQIALGIDLLCARHKKPATYSPLLFLLFRRLYQMTHFFIDHSFECRLNRNARDSVIN